MKFNPLPEEDDSSQLIDQLKEIYKMKAEDRESLARIEAQVAAHIKSRQRENIHLSQQLSYDQQVSNLEQVSHRGHSERIDRLGEKGERHQVRPKTIWLQRLNLSVAIIVVILISGSAVAIFSLMQHRNTANPPAAVSTTHTASMPQTTEKIRQPIYLTSGLRLAMISDEVSWVVGSEAHANNWSELVRTTDGGKTWKQVKIPEGSSALGYTVVIDEVTALVPVGDILSNKYLITFDGGTSWQHFDLPVAKPGLEKDAEPNLITFLDHSQAWIIEPGGAGSAEQKVLFHTTDAGKSWQKVANLSMNGSIFGFVFTDPQAGWLIAEGYGNGSALYATHDGGKTWQQQALPAPPTGSKTPNMLRNLTFTSNRTGYVFFIAGQDTASNVYLYMTQDGGRSWQIRGKALPFDSGFSKVLDPSHISASSLDTKTQLFGAALLTLSNNQWTKKILKSEVEDFAFVSAQVGFALTKPQNQPLDWYKTSDGGKTWVKVGTLP
ncbi:hypothetical protein EPA93_18710 [Ktedonosporobacter rubrisoli]|uniref:Sortilin N-terminal domain-containing protein n=1 Tax=Ktedonosporobacter rubrisoli TaxID=2509675 RepID=A0A4P6JSR1_KTERU|nr:YCF48-related protein [Ktedonosporobacter rubrisoli]QBD77916.1 hypothetical protein EPA93_18710 [Ktedonosporobacter rubrisoli]